MLLRRLTGHVRAQNWFAVALDFLVVVVGIFLAFQVERWYVDQRVRADAQERIDALVEDFIFNREELEYQITRRQTGLDSADILLKLDEQNPTTAEFEIFYQSLAQTSRISTTRFRRGSYNVLISTGEIDLISDKDLRRDIATFFALLDELMTVKVGTAERVRNLFEPYVVRNLDHVQMLEYIHPPDEPNGIGQGSPTQDKSQFLEVLGTVEFEGVVSAMWHSSRDELNQLREMERSLDSIQSRLDQYSSIQGKAN